MHPALDVQEVLFLILESDLTNQDLINCSQVCRVWAIWASDVLWNTKPFSLRRVLEATGSATQRELVIYFRMHAWDVPCLDVGDIDEIGWDQFSSISNRLSRVKIDCKISQDSVQCIEAAKTKYQGEIFTRLRTAEMAVSDVGHQALSLLAVPSLVEASLRCEGMESSSLAWVTDTLPKLTPNVNRLFIQSVYEPQPRWCPFPGLRYLEVFCIYMKYTFWESLLNCPSLSEIGLVDIKYIKAEDEPLQGQYVYFPALNTLRMYYGQQEVIGKLVLWSRMPKLERLLWSSTTRGDFEDTLAVSAHLKVFSPELHTVGQFD